MKKITVYCGVSIEDKCRGQKHPINEVERANELVKSGIDAITYSNSPDFVSAVKHIAEKEKVDVEFFLNGVSCGNDIEPIFADFNIALDLINKYAGVE